MQIKTRNSLTEAARQLREDTLDEFFTSGEAHLGGSFSQIEILVYFYGEVLRSVDKFILSKGHASIPLCLLLKSRGYNPAITTHLERDPDNGVHCTTGSLGHGMPMAVGMALGLKMSNREGAVFVLISDGECQEGTTWESALIASSRNLDNLFVLIDYNKIQALDFVDNILPLGNLAEKFQAFGFECHNVDDGHDFEQIARACESAKCDSGKPKCIVFNTIKGKGVPAFESDPTWHAKKVREKEYHEAKKYLVVK